MKTLVLFLGLATAGSDDSVWWLDEFGLPQEQDFPKAEYFDSLGTGERDYRGFGPFALSSSSPMRMLRMNFTPPIPMALAPGRLLLRESIAWANLWAIDPNRYRIDMEVIRFSTAAFYGLERIQVGVEVGTLSASGGVADAMIEGFHDLFGISNQCRELYPRDEFAITLRIPAGP